MSLMGAPAARAADTAATPVADFFRRPVMSDLALSPDGKHIAMLMQGPEERTVLAVADIATPTRRVGVARFDDADVRSFHWVNNQRLVFDAMDFQSPLGEQFYAGLYAVDVDGGNFMWLVGRGFAQESESHVAVRPLRFNHRLFKTLRDGSPDVVVERFHFRRRHEAGSTTLFRLNTETRALTPLVDDEPANASGWVLDRRLVARAVMSIDSEGVAKVLWRDAAKAPWRELDRFDVFDARAGSITPKAIDGDGRLLVTALRSDAERTSALYRYDADKRALEGPPLLALKGYDFAGEVLFDASTPQPIGFGFVSDAVGVAWVDAGMQALQQRADTLLPATVNIIQCSQCLSARHVIVTAWSDRQSPLYFLLDRETPGRDGLTLIGAAMPWLDTARMARQDLAQITARDGLKFAAYLTKPAGKGPWPTVMLVHGGPFSRASSWGWNRDAQFLASRGYLVVEPDFRGSTGYGDRLFRAGWKQWGLAMQDDVTDATRWAIAQGLADPKRIAIAGASYGGYATMMGLVKEPDLYRAGINWVGVTDIGLMYSIDWSDLSDVWQRYGMPRLVGDPDKDGAQLDATSPLKRAREITKPVLMAYGTKDRRVPLPHGTRMRDALEEAGRVEVEWVTYEDEGHGFLLLKNEVDFWQRVERFLAKHLK
jgi:dipeptidyl aminopeptidase/acylaminoacyl peptidase